MTFLFPFSFHFRRVIPIPISIHYHPHFWQRLYIDYIEAEKYVYCVANSKQNMKLQQKHC